MTDAQRWITVAYSLPPEPSRKRVLVWRHLRKAGALYLETGFWFLPFTTATAKAIAPILTEASEMGGRVHAFVATSIDADQDEELRDAYNQARREEYADLLERCQRFLTHVQRLTEAADFRIAAVEELEEDLEKRRRSLAQVVARDVFCIQDREGVEASLRLCEEALAGFVEMAYLAS